MKIFEKNWTTVFITDRVQEMEVSAYHNYPEVWLGLIVYLSGLVGVTVVAALSGIEGSTIKLLLTFLIGF